MQAAMPDVTGMDVFDAACKYAAHGVAVAPFDPTKGKGKSCWNLVGYREVTTDLAQLQRWRQKFGPFAALASSPGAFGSIVIDVDHPPHVPRHLRPHLDDAVFVATRPGQTPKRGHYWFTLPPGVQFGNPTLPFGEVRCVGGGVVMPPYGDRRIVRPGPPPAIPGALAEYLAGHTVQAGAGRGQTGRQMTVGQFCARYTGNARPHKLDALVKLHSTKLRRSGSAHDAMREALKVGLGEARIGYVPARAVIVTLRDLWDRDRNEFRRLVHWAIDVAETSDAHQLRVKSDRCPGTDSRIDYF